MFHHEKVVNIYIVAVALTKNADIDKCKYSGYGVGFDKKRISFTL